MIKILLVKSSYTFSKNIKCIRTWTSPKDFSMYYNKIIEIPKYIAVSNGYVFYKLSNLKQQCTKYQHNLDLFENLYILDDIRYVKLKLISSEYKDITF